MCNKRLNLFPMKHLWNRKNSRFENIFKVNKMINSLPRKKFAIWRRANKLNAANIGQSRIWKENIKERLITYHSTKEADTKWINFFREARYDILPLPHYTLLYDAFNKFPYFFVQAFKIAVDSWKFSILLLYILWDDWPIFMISASNKQLQRQLEYTPLKPDCHSWWISKMKSEREDTLEERYVIKLCFKLGKNDARETYEMLQTAFRASCMNRASVFECHKRFKEGRESVREDDRCWRSKEVNTPELIG